MGRRQYTEELAAHLAMTAPPNARGMSLNRMVWERTDLGLMRDRVGFA